MVRNSEVRHGAVKYLARLLLQRAVGVGLFYLAAGTFNDIRSAVNLALYLVASVIAGIIMYSGHQETLYERGKKQDNTKGWDKILLPIYVLLAYMGIYIVAGLGVRFMWNTLPMEWFYTGTVLYLISSVFSVWPVSENKRQRRVYRATEAKRW